MLNTRLSTRCISNPSVLKQRSWEWGWDYKFRFMFRRWELLNCAEIGIGNRTGEKTSGWQTKTMSSEPENSFCKGFSFSIHPQHSKNNFPYFSVVIHLTLLESPWLLGWVSYIWYLHCHQFYQVLSEASPIEWLRVHGQR